MDTAHREAAARLRERVCDGELTPSLFRAALESRPAAQRDAWVDLLLGLEELPDDGPALPSGCVPYLPCPVDAVLRAIEHAEVKPEDVFVDVGSGLGRVTTLARLATGAASIGIEIQPELVRASRALARRLNLSRVQVVEGDAAKLTELITIGSVFFLYCPFSDERLERVLDGLERIAQTRQIRVCLVGLSEPARSWLTPISPPQAEVAVYRSRAPRWAASP